MPRTAHLGQQQQQQAQQQLQPKNANASLASVFNVVRNATRMNIRGLGFKTPAPALTLYPSNTQPEERAQQCAPVDDRFVGFARQLIISRQLDPPVYRGISDKPAIPPERPRLKVVLDIDECLVHSVFPDDNEYRQKEFRPQLHGTKSRCESFEMQMDDGQSCIVNKRPGLDEFLQTCCREFDTYAFTAGLEIYATPLMNHLDPDGLLKGRFYRRDCTFRRGYYLKDLETVSDDMSRIVLVDNNPVSFLFQPENGIPVTSFYDDAADTEFESVLNVLRSLQSVDDVREPLGRIFNLKAGLRTARKQIFGSN
jgi:CTD small phosphatase-like protein 2